MNRRSRAGCIDCRRSKVKCDELQPFCGTCTRRGRKCQGYATDKYRTPSETAENAASVTSGDQKRASSGSPSCTDVVLASERASYGRDEISTASLSVGYGRCSSELKIRTMPVIPPGVIKPEDEDIIQVYFHRHPSEMAMGYEFVDEMNTNVLRILQHSPTAIGDSLSGIGQVYLSKNQQSSVVSVLDRRARILASLRDMQVSGYDLEPQVMLLLSLSAMELVDTATLLKDMTIPTVVANCAALLDYHINVAGREISPLAKYFIRALARQDIMLALTLRRRSLISTDIWLDEECQSSADRLMGYTTTLMPLLSELSALAEDVRTLEYNKLQADPELSYLKEETLQRAATLRSRIDAWRPKTTPGVPFRVARKYLSQAHAYQSATLLYLYRLINPPQSSAEADAEALKIAHDILIYTSGPPQELRMLLWPVFLAACEALDAEDRSVCLEVFDSICEHRKTATALRTGQFCTKRVWTARDSGLEWNWMKLVEQYPGECLPI
jgi:hypothetical protein